MLWRHGQTNWNAEHRFQGQTDIPLDDTGVAQAEYTAQRLATLRPAQIFASDLSRAQQTAAALSKLTGLPVTLDKDLRERHGGDWEGLTDEEIRERYPAERASWDPPNGESTTAVGDRMSAAFGRVGESLADGELAVIVSHGGALRIGVERILGLPGQGIGVLGPLANCSWSVLSLHATRWRLLEYNAQTVPEPVIGDDR